MTTTETKYDEQAAEFCRTFGVRVTVNRKGRETCPPDRGFTPDGPTSRNDCATCGSVHGDAYRVTLSYATNPPHPQPCAFNYWGSQHDRLAGTHPSRYDILACVASDSTSPDTFEEFCGEYGYDADSRKAHALFKRCAAFAKRLRAFFASDEIREALAEIR